MPFSQCDLSDLCGWHGRRARFDTACRSLEIAYLVVDVGGDAGGQ